MYALDIAYRAHVGDGRDLFEVGLIAALRHNVSKQLPFRNPENTFLRILFDVEPSKVREHCSQVCDQVASLSRFDHYVINIDNDCWFWSLSLIRLIERVDLVSKALLHAPLVGGVSVLQTKRHGYVIIQTIRGDEQGCKLIRLSHRDLVIA